MSDVILSRNILYYIDNSQEIKFTWSIDTDTLARHTAIVLHFDDKPQVTLDFIANNQNQSRLTTFFNCFTGVSQLAAPVSAMAINAGLHVIPFNHDSNIQILGSILKFMIFDQEGKERAKKLITSILEMDIGQYNAKTNNCRNFVKKAFGKLRKEPECNESDQVEFERQMKQIEADDQDKVETVRNVGLGIGVGGILAWVAIVTAKLVLR